MSIASAYFKMEMSLEQILFYPSGEDGNYISMVVLPIVPPAE